MCYRSPEEHTSTLMGSREQAIMYKQDFLNKSTLVCPNVSVASFSRGPDQASLAQKATEGGVKAVWLQVITIFGGV